MINQAILEVLKELNVSMKSLQRKVNALEKQGSSSFAYSVSVRNSSEQMKKLQDSINNLEDLMNSKESK